MNARKVEDLAAIFGHSAEYGRQKKLEGKRVTGVWGMRMSGLVNVELFHFRPQGGPF